MIWPSGVRETVLEADSSGKAFDTDRLFPDEWGPRVQSVTVLGGEIGYVGLTPRQNSFSRSKGVWSLAEHASEWGFRAEWVLARWVAAGAVQQFHEDTKLAAGLDRGYTSDVMCIVVHRQPDGLWSLSEIHKRDSTGWVYRLTRFSDWRMDGDLGWVAQRQESAVFRERGDLAPSYIESGTLHLIKVVPNVPENALKVNLKDALTLDHDSRIVSNASGTKVGTLPVSGMAAGWRWGTIVAIAGVVLAVAATGGYYLKKKASNASS